MCGGLALGVVLARGAEAQSAVTVLLVRADTLWDAGRTDSAAVLYRAALAQDSLATPRAVLRVATVFSWTTQTDSALRYFARYERMQPADARGPMGRARTLAWASRYAASLAVLDSVVQAAPTERDAVLLRAQVQAWAGDLGGATSAYRAWLAAHADDDDARAGLARTLSWDGKFDDAAAEYRALEPRVPAEAAKGLARVTAWRGDLEAARVQWAEVTAKYPADPEGWTGLGQVERWQGRPRDADRALAQALAVSPGYADALSQRAWVRADLAPSTDLLVAYANDSDQNRTLTTALGFAIAPPWQGKINATVQLRRAEFAAFSGTTSALRVGTQWTPLGAAWSMRGELGLTLYNADNLFVALDPSTLTPLVPQPAKPGDAQASYMLRVSGPVVSGVVGGLTVSGGAFDETALLMAHRIRTDGVDADVTATLPGRFTLEGTLGYAKIGNGGVPNARLGYAATLRYALARGSWFGVTARGYRYDAAGVGDGYFAPQKFLVGEGAAHFELPREVGWNVLADAGIGMQAIRVSGTPESSKAAQRAQLGVLFRPVPGGEASLTIWVANVASPFSATSDYRAGGITARGRLLF